MSCRTLLALSVIFGLSLCKSTNQIRICQGDTTDLVCPPGQELTIENAKYGRFVSPWISCPHKGLDAMKEFNCVSDVTALVEGSCYMRQQCRIKATNRNLGDPCKGIFKHLDIQFHCAPPPIATSTWDTAPFTSATSPNTHSKSSLSMEVVKCTQLYTEIMETSSNMECEALKAYKECLIEVEIKDPSTAKDINRVIPTLDDSLVECNRIVKEPHIMLCKRTKLKGECINITSAMSNLGDFDNVVKSVKVFAGSWSLYTDPNYQGTVDHVSSGFLTHWLGVYAPIKGDPISLYSNDLSSLRPVEKVQNVKTKNTLVGYPFTDTTVPPTGNTDIHSTPRFYEASFSYSEGVLPSVTSREPETDSAEYSQWVNLDDISSSNHPHMCRKTYCLLGIRVIYPLLGSIPTLTRHAIENILLTKLVDTYGIHPEQLVLAEVVERSSEIILEIADMKGAPIRVMDVAITIEDSIKREDLLFTFGDITLVPEADRYGVMLKTIDERMLPSPRATEQVTTQKITTEQTVNENEKTASIIFMPSTSSYVVSTSINDNDTEEKFEMNIPGLPKKFLLPFLVTVCLVFAATITVLATVVFRCLRNKDYTLIKKVPSEPYIPAEPLPKKCIEGFENPSYLLEEVDHNM